MAKWNPDKQILLPRLLEPKVRRTEQEDKLTIVSHVLMNIFTLCIGALMTLSVQAESLPLWFAIVIGVFVVVLSSIERFSSEEDKNRGK